MKKVIIMNSDKKKKQMYKNHRRNYGECKKRVTKYKYQEDFKQCKIYNYDMENILRQCIHQ